MPEPKRPLAELPIYFFGCDMGGWHTEEGDALAVCKWDGEELIHVEADCGSFFYPIPEEGLVDAQLRVAKEAGGRIIIAIDAALAWPIDFVGLVQNAPLASHLASFVPAGSIENPYLYRKTERFVKKYVLTGNKEWPLTAPGDRFGNNSSKAQCLTAWFNGQLPNCYRPPFNEWSVEQADTRQFSIIEVYPAASMKSEKFKELAWPEQRQTMRRVGNTDIADAKRCAMTAMCYAMTVGVIKHHESYPLVFHPGDEEANGYDQQAIAREGWIFAPYDKKPKRK